MLNFTGLETYDCRMQQGLMMTCVYYTVADANTFLTHVVISLGAWHRALLRFIMQSTCSNVATRETSTCGNLEDSKT